MHSERGLGRGREEEREQLARRHERLAFNLMAPADALALFADSR